jgi:hypothetical protein
MGLLPVKFVPHQVKGWAAHPVSMAGQGREARGAPVRAAGPRIPIRARSFRRMNGLHQAKNVQYYGSLANGDMHHARVMCRRVAVVSARWSPRRNPSFSH